jgi:predicted nucleic acid-binding protein
MTKLRVFPDTGALLSMIVFPTGQQGQPTLAGEILGLYQEGLFEIIISQEVVEELLEVIREEFPDASTQVSTFLLSFTPYLTRKPTPEEVADSLPYTVDQDDAPIFAAAVIAQPDIVLSNDFETFHTPKAKRYWKKHGIQIESLYGLLCVFGRRQRKPRRRLRHS